MTTVLLATGNVHEAAALCDYLADRLRGDDVVHAVGVAHETAKAAERPSDDGTAQSTRGAASRDRADALNAVRSRLGAVATVEIDDSDGVEPIGLLDRARSIDADEIALADGALAAKLLSAAERPVVVVPR